MRVKYPIKEIDIDPEGLLAGALHRMVDRLIASNKIVLALAKLNRRGELQWPGALIDLARKYVAKEMRHEVGVRKLARQWEQE